ncbi:E3 ubiquitin-protein ligase RNF186-like [Astyanax mexicanus]|uniref:E3 ubiquitin-protein ligase RNF186-like n=1 Tax=Astyanax mexicanus TaxID=7994 RepID=UPI0020CAFBD3|nr:E3 ubiquitin-protein ligase RNF186-like [Astyanax mexicanus]
MNEAPDLEAPASAEKSQTQQVSDPVLGAHLTLTGMSLDQERMLGSLDHPFIEDHLNDGKTLYRGSLGMDETPAAFDTDGPRPKWSEVLSGECLAREPLLNEHFNNPLPQRSQQTVSRTEVTDGGTSRTLGPACREYVSGSGPVQDGSSSVVDECPICTESYQSRGDRSMALLNCDHSLCQRCLAAMLRRAADCSRVQCPLCRQKTPLLQWEICRLQEDSTFCMVPPNPSSAMLAQAEAEPEPEPVPPDRGLCSALEHRLLLRAETARVCGCFEHPRWLMQLVRRLQLQRRCSCCYMTLLIFMYLAEVTFLLLVFLPVVVLVLLFTLAS